MKKRRNPYSSIQLYVGKMKPINEGLYSKKAVNSNHKPLTKIFVEPGSYYWTKSF